MTDTTDILDIAYMAIGAYCALKESKAYPPAGGGELEYIREVIEYHPVLTKLWEEQGDDFGAVWAYEVAEPLGHVIGLMLLAGQPVNVSLVEEAARNLLLDCEADEELVH